ASVRSHQGNGTGGTQGGEAEQKPAALSNEGIAAGHGYALPPAVSNRPARTGLRNRPHGSRQRRTTRKSCHRGYRARTPPDERGLSLPKWGRPPCRSKIGSSDANKG